MASLRIRVSLCFFFVFVIACSSLASKPDQTTVQHSRVSVHSAIARRDVSAGATDEGALSPSLHLRSLVRRVVEDKDQEKGQKSEPAPSPFLSKSVSELSRHLASADLRSTPQEHSSMDNPRGAKSQRLDSPLFLPMGRQRATEVERAGINRAFSGLSIGDPHGSLPSEMPQIRMRKDDSGKSSPSTPGKSPFSTIQEPSPSTPDHQRHPFSLQRGSPQERHSEAPTDLTHQVPPSFNQRPLRLDSAQQRPAKMQRVKSFQQNLGAIRSVGGASGSKNDRLGYWMSHQKARIYPGATKDLDLYALEQTQSVSFAPSRKGKRKRVSRSGGKPSLGIGTEGSDERSSSDGGSEHESAMAQSGSPQTPQNQGVGSSKQHSEGK